MHLPCGTCNIRSWEPRDIDELVRHAHDRDVAINMRDRFPHPYTRADAEQWVRFAAGQAPETNFAIALDDRAVGGIGLTLHDDVERVSAEVGYWLGREVWGRGLATAALRHFTAWAFPAHRLTRVYALPFADNLASLRVLEKAGFRREGVLRRSAIKAGVVRDQAVYARVDTDVG